jgi:hypothetical protein
MTIHPLLSKLVLPSELNCFLGTVMTFGASPSLRIPGKFVLNTRDICQNPIYAIFYCTYDTDSTRIQPFSPHRTLCAHMHLHLQIAFARQQRRGAVSQALRRLLRSDLKWLGCNCTFTSRISHHSFCTLMHVRTYHSHSPIGEVEAHSRLALSIASFCTPAPAPATYIHASAKTCHS